MALDQTQAPDDGPGTAPITDPERISSIAFGFMASKALFAGLHAGVFDALAGAPKTADELVAATGITKRRLTTLLTALLSVGLVARRDGRYANAPATEAYLVREAPSYFGDYLRFQIDRQMYPLMNQLDAVLKGDIDAVEVESYESWMADPEEAKLFSHSQHTGSLGPGAVLAKRLDLSGAKTLLDVGGGTGAFAIMMAKRHPHLAVTVMDFPNVVACGRAYVEEAGVADRVTFVGGNALSDPWPLPQDAILMSYLMGGVPGDALPQLAKAAFEGLSRGGLFVVHDFMVEDDRSGPALAALWALQHMVFTPEAASLTPGAVRRLMEGAGFVDIETVDLIPGMTKVLTARKPA